MARIHNFSAGPAALPPTVLEQARDELLEYPGAGASIMEISHRGKIYDAIIKGAEANLRRLMDIPDDYAVLFMPGGASQQFAVLPLNLLPPGRTAEFIHTGAWSEKAIKEARIAGTVRIAWDGKDDRYMRIPRPEELSFGAGADAAAYVHLCTNETIGGVQWPYLPDTETPLVADMSSDILSRPLDVRRFGAIYAGAQKNIGPSGLAVVILRRDLAERCPDTVPAFLRYKTHMAEPSLYNTPNTWAVYLVKLITDWMIAQGGVAAFERRSIQKSSLLYDTLDASGFWRPCARRDGRSRMNATWRLAREELEDAFVKEAKAEGLDGLKGHRSVGGIRASLYNAVPMEAVEALVQFMREFERRHG